MLYKRSWGPAARSWKIFSKNIILPTLRLRKIVGFKESRIQGKEKRGTKGETYVEASRRERTWWVPRTERSREVCSVRVVQVSQRGRELQNQVEVVN